MAVNLEPGLRRQSNQTALSPPPSGPARALDVLFIMPSLANLRHFRSPLELLVDRGHNVHLLLERMRRARPGQLWLERMTEHPNFAFEIADHFTDDRSRRNRKLLQGMEYVRSLDPSYTSSAGAEKRYRRAPRAIRWLTRNPLIRSPLGLRTLYRTLSVIEGALPAPGRAAQYMERRHPDLVALCDYGAPGSLQSGYVKAAKKLGIPVAICVASWDNLTTRQRTRVVPHRFLVWNETQVREATEIHGIPADRVCATGAPCFDHWFSWKPRPRSEFLARVGLDPSKPVVLWVGGTLFPSRRTEAEFAAAWVAALRSSSDPTLREIGVLLRPHPKRLKPWLAVDFSPLGNAAVWPRQSMAMLGEAEKKSDYYDSFFHSSAVIGVNTTAMIEGLIVGRPVLTVIEPEFHDSQLGMVHFSYLLEPSGGAVRVARSVEESFAELSAILDGRAGDDSRARRFVTDFVRPRGIDRPATPIFVETLEQLTDTPVQPERDPLSLFAARGLVVPAYWVSKIVADGVRRLLPASLREALGSSLRRVRKGLATRARARAKRTRHLVLVWLRAAVRARVERLRG